MSVMLKCARVCGRAKAGYCRAGWGRCWGGAGGVGRAASARHQCPSPASSYVLLPREPLVGQSQNNDVYNRHQRGGTVRWKKWEMFIDAARCYAVACVRATKTVLASAVPPSRCGLNPPAKCATVGEGIRQVESPLAVGI